MRAIRNRYFPRSAPDIVDQVVSYALRAALTARSTSRGPAAVISERTSSSAGLTVLNAVPSNGSTNAPSMNSPYDGLIWTTARDSGAAAYVNVLPTMRGLSVSR